MKSIKQSLLIDNNNNNNNNKNTNINNNIINQNMHLNHINNNTNNNNDNNNKNNSKFNTQKISASSPKQNENNNNNIHHHRSNHNHLNINQNNNNNNKNNNNNNQINVNNINSHTNNNSNSLSKQQRLLIFSPDEYQSVPLNLKLNFLSKNKPSSPSNDSSKTPSHKNRKFLLPASNSKKKTLILDLDETLVHSAFKPFNIKDDITITIQIENKSQIIHILTRPFLSEFLKKMSKIFEIVIFTASIPQYANPLLDKLENIYNNNYNNYISHRLFRQHCIKTKGNYIKDLHCLGRKKENMIIVDNNPISYVYNVENGLPIGSFHCNKNDNELAKLCFVLEYLSQLDDVREGIRKIVKNNIIDYNRVGMLFNENKKNFNGSFLFGNSLNESNIINHISNNSSYINIKNNNNNINNKNNNKTNGILYKRGLSLNYFKKKSINDNHPRCFINIRNNNINNINNINTNININNTCYNSNNNNNNTEKKIFTPILSNNNIIHERLLSVQINTSSNNSNNINININNNNIHIPSQSISNVDNNNNNINNIINYINNYISNNNNSNIINTSTLSHISNNSQTKLINNNNNNLHLSPPSPSNYRTPIRPIMSKSNFRTLLNNNFMEKDKNYNKNDKNVKNNNNNNNEHILYDYNNKNSSNNNNSNINISNNNNSNNNISNSNNSNSINSNNNYNSNCNSNNNSSNDAEKYLINIRKQINNINRNIQEYKKNQEKFNLYTKKDYLYKYKNIKNNNNKEEEINNNNYSSSTSQTKDEGIV